MTFGGSHFLSLAKELAGLTTASSHQEAHFRSAVSRAYYAIFWEARDFIREVTGYTILPSGRAHREVRDALRREGSRRSVRLFLKIARQMERLHEDRKAADYAKELEGDISRTCRGVVLSAERLIEQLWRLRHSGTDSRQSLEEEQT